MKMTNFKKAILEVDCGGHVSEQTFMHFLNEVNLMADDLFDGRVDIILTSETKTNEIERIFREHYYLKQIIAALDNHTREHGMISRLMFTEVLNIGLVHSGIIMEGIND